MKYLKFNFNKLYFCFSFTFNFNYLIFENLYMYVIYFDSISSY